MKTRLSAAFYGLSLKTDALTGPRDFPALATPCNGNCNRVDQGRSKIVALDGCRMALANAPEVGIAGLANDAQIGESGWVVIPFGDSSHSGKEGRIGSESERTPEQMEAERMGVTQRFTREDAVALVNDFKSTWGKLKRAIVGLPVFKGHPDAPRFAKQFPDRTPRGTIADMEVRDTGLALRPVLTEQGAADVEHGWKFVSPYWLGRHVGDEAGRKVVAPYKLLSLGLVPRGNIPDLSLVNAAELESDSPKMKELLIKLLAALGHTVAATADDAALANAVDAGVATATTVKADKATADATVATLTAEKARIEGEKTALANASDTLMNRATSAETALRQLRTSAAKHRVGLAVKAGKISAADAPAQETALANAADFEMEAAKIDQLTPKLRTASQLGALGRDGKEQQGRQQSVVGLVNAYMDANGCDYDTAFTAVKNDPKHAAIFGAMKSPASN